MTTETILWRDPVTDLAPLEETVLVCYQDDKRRPEVFLGYQDEDDIWRDLSGVPYDRVLAWAPMPQGVRP